MRDPHLPVTLATLVFLVRRSGQAVTDGAVEAACAAFETGGKPVEALGEALVGAVKAHLKEDAPEDVSAALRAIFGGATVRTDLGEAPDRETRAAAIRRAHFGNHLPWLAVIIERLHGGEVGRRWVLVESFDDAARVMDPNPWDDKDEERALPINDFLVQWELAGCPSVRVG